MRKNGPEYSIRFASPVTRLKGEQGKNKIGSPLVEASRFVVGVAGFEPATLCSQSRCANRAALHPEHVGLAAAGLRSGFDRLDFSLNVARTYHLLTEAVMSICFLFGDDQFGHFLRLSALPEDLIAE